MLLKEQLKVEMTGNTMRKDAEKPTRPIRSRRYTRRNLVLGHRPYKRLFTPEIKRYLKDWLVRRRENPYPNREEKKYLAQETGLTYIQICNWFANWRRKLKNVDAQQNQQTWGHLIRTYNDKAQGNVEQFSISSEDSIWSEFENGSHDGNNTDISEKQEQLSDHIHEKIYGKPYESEMNDNNNSSVNQLHDSKQTSPVLLSKWLESAARFQPSEANYSWWGDIRKKNDGRRIFNVWSKHGQDEVEAAVALTALASSRIETGS